MLRSLTCALAFTLATASFADETGWTVGLGVVSSDVSPEAESPFFPSFRTEQDTKQYMLIPNLSYQWQRWSIGADGVGYKVDNTLGGSTSAKVGFPSSSASIAGQRGWFRYGVNSQLNYADGLLAGHGFTLGPLDYSIQYGLNDRSDELSQKLGLGFPLYLNQKAGLTVIGSGYAQQDNRAFSEQDLELGSPLAQENYLHQGLNVFAVYQANAKTTLLVSGTLQFNDEALVDEVARIEPVSFNIFTLFSYRFGL